ncbi:MAG: methyltransferase domain-containing protein [Candidatus Moranbacteria bacterium]|nr:methyltransferase domain-containing protein [Candidatus Moranbacteria bacterium]
MKQEIDERDLRHFKLLRDNVSHFIEDCAKKYDDGGLLLDVAPQDHAGAKEWFRECSIETLDIDPNSSATYIADICVENSRIIPDSRFDRVLCAEVLEHTLNPFAAVVEIRRMLKQDGLAFFSAPFDFRIHGPLPDCWRFSEHGWRALLSHGWEILALNALESERFLMPIHYTVVAKKIDQ